jgi:PQQ-dependent catabolism-associated CXXCW motif protein
MQHASIRTGFLIAGLIVASAASMVRAGGDDVATDGDSVVAEPADYRMDQYRAPTPTTLSGGTVLETAEVQALLQQPGTILIDVLPHQKRPDNLPPDTVWNPQPRFNIPGSIWLPDVGRGALNESVEAYFKNNLERLTGADRDRKIVIYCLADCWMSWNAAKRVIAYGYSSVYWYPGGTDDWTAAGLQTEESQPVPMEGESPAIN